MVSQAARSASVWRAGVAEGIGGAATGTDARSGSRKTTPMSQQRYGHRGGETAAQPAPADQVAAVVKVVRPPVRGSPDQRDRLAQLLGQGGVVDPVGVVAPSRRPGLAGQHQDLVDRAAADLGDLHARQLGVALQHDHRPLVRRQPLQVGNDLRRGGSKDGPPSISWIRGPVSQGSCGSYGEVWTRERSASTRGRRMSSQRS